MNACTHCPRPAEVDEDGTHPMCWQCFSAFLLGVVRHDTPAAPVLVGSVAS